MTSRSIWGSDQKRRSHRFSSGPCVNHIPLNTQALLRKGLSFYTILIYHIITMSVVNFIYSGIYDQILSELSNNFDEKQSGKIKDWMTLLSDKWLEYEQKVIEGLKKYPPFKFEYDQVNCYLVSNLPYTGFSDPLTIKIRENVDLDLVIATLIHELVHISIEKDEANLISKVEQIFPEVTEKKILLHIVVNFIEYQIIKELFNKETFDKIMNRELLLKGIRPAWDIVLADEEKLMSLFT